MVDHFLINRVEAIAAKDTADDYISILAEELVR